MSSDDEDDAENTFPTVSFTKNWCKTLSNKVTGYYCKNIYHQLFLFIDWNRYQRYGET